MNKKPAESLSRRERQIMDIIYREGEASASEVQNNLSDSPSNSSVRTLLRVLENKGHLKHEEKGLKYVYSPTLPQEKAGGSALNHLMRTFFSGSPSKVVAAILDGSDTSLSEEELEKIESLILKMKKEEK